MLHSSVFCSLDSDDQIQQPNWFVVDIFLGTKRIYSAITPNSANSDNSTAYTGSQFNSKEIIPSQNLVMRNKKNKNKRGIFTINASNLTYYLSYLCSSFLFYQCSFSNSICSQFISKISRQFLVILSLILTKDRLLLQTQLQQWIMQ